MVYRNGTTTRTKTTRKRPGMGSGIAEKGARTTERGTKRRMGRAAGIARKIPRR